MQKPVYKIKIGSTIFDSTTGQEIISISVDLDLDVPSDSFNIALIPGTKASSIKNGDAVVIEMGYEEALNKVFTGAVNMIEPKISGVVISGLSAISMLTTTRVNQVYEKQTAGSIVKDLASRARIVVKDVDEGLSFPMYVVDDAKDVYTHMKELSRKCGFDLFLTGDRKLVFKKYARQTPKSFKYGRDIIEAEVNEPTPIAVCVKVYGESPSSFKGADTAHWMSKKPVEGVAESGDVIFLIEDPTVRDKDTADKVALAMLETIMIPLSGTLKVLGNARVGLGDTIEIRDLPDPKMNGEFEATSVSHIFNKNEGFVSILGWVKKIKRAPAEPPLALFPATSAAPKQSPLEEQLESATGNLEDKRQKLQDAVETSEAELEDSLFEINNARAEQDKAANELLEAAEETRKASMGAAKEMSNKADELKKELEARKKEIEDAEAEAKAKFEEYKEESKAQIEKNEQEINKLKEDTGKAVNEAKIKELEGKNNEIKKFVDGAEKEQAAKVDETKKKLDETVKEIQAQIDEAEKNAEKIEKESEEKFAEAKKKVEEARKEAGKKFEDTKKAYREAREKVMEAKKQAGMD